mmetsp:Transcript_43631/g.120674  ORF Transcript_43631/g.120674 Transcript_43631/m.120674 type:complete len:465 (-) Transcript_43631:1196-2590(-)
MPSPSKCPGAAPSAVSRACPRAHPPTTGSRSALGSVGHLALGRPAVGAYGWPAAHLLLLGERLVLRALDRRAQLGLEVVELEREARCRLGRHLVVALLLLALLLGVLRGHLLGEVVVPAPRVLLEALGLDQRVQLRIRRLPLLDERAVVGLRLALLRDRAAGRRILLALQVAPIGHVGAPHADRAVPRRREVLLLLGHVDDAAHRVRVADVLLDHLLRDRVVHAHRAVHRRRDDEATLLVDGERGDRVARQPLGVLDTLRRPEAHRRVLRTGDPQAVRRVPLDVRDVGAVPLEHAAEALALAPLGHRRAAVDALARLRVDGQIPQLGALVGGGSGDLIELGRVGEREYVVVVRVLDPVRRRALVGQQRLAQVPQAQREVPRRRRERVPHAHEARHAVGMLPQHARLRVLGRRLVRRLVGALGAGLVRCHRPDADRVVVAAGDERVERVAVERTEHGALVARQRL